MKVAVVSDSAILHASSLSLLQGIFPTQGLNPGLPKLQVDSLPVESPGKPKNTKVGNLSLLQGIFQTQQSNGSPTVQVDSLPTELLGKPSFRLRIGKD